MEGVIGILDHHMDFIAAQMIKWIRGLIIRFQLGYFVVWRNHFFYNPLREWRPRIIAERVGKSSIVSLELHKLWIELVQLPFIVIKLVGFLIPPSNYGSGAFI